MASRKEQKAQAKQERLAAQAAREAAERRSKLIRWSLAAVAVVIVVVGAYFITSQSKQSGNGGSQIAGVSQALRLIGNAEQQGNNVGDPKAKVSIMEFADLRCPVCKRFSEEVYPKIFPELIQTDKAKLEFNNWAILGPESVAAGKAALAAGRQDKGFLFAEIFYLNQKNEATPYVTDEFLTSIAKAAGLDIAQWNKDRQDPKIADKLAQINDEAVQAGFTGTPSIIVKGPGGSTNLESGATAEVIAAAVDQVSK